MEGTTLKTGRRNTGRIQSLDGRAREASYDMCGPATNSYQQDVRGTEAGTMSKKAGQTAAQSVPHAEPTLDPTTYPAQSIEHLMAQNILVSSLWHSRRHKWGSPLTDQKKPAAISSSKPGSLAANSPLRHTLLLGPTSINAGCPTIRSEPFSTAGFLAFTVFLAGNRTAGSRLKARNRKGCGALSRAHPKQYSVPVWLVCTASPPPPPPPWAPSLRCLAPTKLVRNGGENCFWLVAFVLCQLDPSPTTPSLSLRSWAFR